MMNPVSTQIAALTAVPGDLIRSIGASAAYRDEAQGLLSLASDLDNHLFQMVQRVPKEGVRTDFFTDFDGLDLTEARELAISLLRKKESIEARLPALNAVCKLMFHVSHTIANLVPLVGTPEPVATLSSKGILVHYHHVDKPAYEWSLAIYMGLSPFPVFGQSLDYEAAPVVRYLSRFGFGVFTFLHLACHPEMAAEGRLPRHILYKDRPRPVAPAMVHILADGSIVL